MKLVPSLKYLLDNIGTGGFNCAQYVVPNVQKGGDSKFPDGGLPLKGASPVHVSPGFFQVLGIDANGIIECKQNCHVDIRVRGDIPMNFPAAKGVPIVGYIRFGRTLDTVVDYVPNQLACTMTCSLALKVGDQIMISIGCSNYSLQFPSATISIRTFS